jgi:hypothetical protein
MALKINTRYTNKEKFSETFFGLVLKAIVLTNTKVEDLPMYSGWMLHYLQMEAPPLKLAFLVGVKGFGLDHRLIGPSN